jgi:hypothetical protein
MEAPECLDAALLCHSKGRGQRWQNENFMRIRDCNENLQTNSSGIGKMELEEVAVVEFEHTKSEFDT